MSWDNTLQLRFTLPASSSPSLFEEAKCVEATRCQLKDASLVAELIARI